MHAAEGVPADSLVFVEEQPAASAPRFRSFNMVTSDLRPDGTGAEGARRPVRTDRPQGI